MGAKLKGAYIADVTLTRAQLMGADLRNAIVERGSGLEGVDLSHALVSDEQLGHFDLRGATMPNGQKYEEWLKSKGRGEDGENSGTS